MRIIIHGPNLADQRQGSFQIHAADCGDNAKVRYLGGAGTAETAWTLEVDDRAEAVEEVYSDQLGEGADFQSCRDDLYFNPCCSGLPEGSR